MLRSRDYATAPSRASRKLSPWATALRRALAIPLAICVLATAGCGGCDSQQSTQQLSEEEKAEREKKLAEKKEKKEKLEIKPLLPLIGQEPPPESDDQLPADSTGPGLLVKPGHWTTTVQEMKANYEDFVGQSSTTLVDSRQRPAPLQHTNFTFQSTRPVALAKGRMKRVEGELFIPEQSAGIQVRASLADRNTGSQLPVGQPLLRKMPSYQYFIVVVSKEISKYGFLKVTDAVRMPWEEEFDTVSQPHYRIVLVDANKSIPLPGNTLTWSSVSHLFWDEVDPTRLSPEQRSALVDWLHWGGRLIINGPDSLDALRGSFLADFLPADSSGPRSLTTAELSNWSAYWSNRQRGKSTPDITIAKPWSGISLQPRAGAKVLPGDAQLFYELRVGKGTVVLSAFQLAERDLINWPGYDSFLNAALLRRPRRVYAEGTYGGPQIGWADFGNRRLDAHFSTGLRWFARDARTRANQWREEEPADNLFTQAAPVTTSHVERPGGMGTWSEFNPVSNAAREVLTDAAAVRVPGAGFVIGCLGFYLVVLVPLNWMVFRSLGRVEWAWIAAPVIALLGTLVIVRQAQLDIGFVRSQTEVALLELQASHSRGLLSRFTALYSSLSTTYDVTYDDPTTVATPFPAKQSDSETYDEKIWDVVFEKQKETRLSGLAVSSASTKMVHSEEIFSLAGPLKFSQSSRGHDQLENRLGFDLHSVLVVQRYFENDEPAKYKSSWIGELRDGESSTIGLQTLDIGDEAIQIGKLRESEKSTPRSKIDVDGLLDIALLFPESEDPLEQRRDELRVVGLIDQVLPGTEVSPHASQIVGATVVLAHLEYGELPPAIPDVNSRSDVLKIKPTAFDGGE